MTLRRLTRTALMILATGLLLAFLASPSGAQDAANTQSALADLLLADGMNRGQMAEGLIGALQVAGFQPQDCVPGEELFDDVPASSPFCPFIEELARRGITGGCDDDNFCPGDAVSRSQMAVFVVRPIAMCGDDMAEGAEVCDGTDLAGEDCVTQGFDDGTLACAADCMSFDTSGCVTFICGNGVVEGAEVCDGEDLAGETCETQGFDGGDLACAADCMSFDTSGCI